MWLSAFEVERLYREGSGHAAALGRDLPVQIQSPSNVFRERLNPRGIQGETGG